MSKEANHPQSSLPTNLKQNYTWRFLLTLPIFKAIASSCFIALVSLVLFLIATSFVYASHTRIWLNGYQSPGTIKPLNAIAGKPFTVYVMVSDVDDAEGLAAFGFTLSYDNRLVTIPDTDGNYFADPSYVNWQNQGVWITFPAITTQAGARSSYCSEGVVKKSLVDVNLNEITFSCGTAGPTPPGPQGSGVLASITFDTQKVKTGQTKLNFVDSELIDVTADVNPIPHQKVNGLLSVYPCADLIADGSVSIGDIGAVVLAFGSVPASSNWNAQADLNGDGSVTVSDIGIAVSQFGQTCP